MITGTIERQNPGYKYHKINLNFSVLKHFQEGPDTFN